MPQKKLTEHRKFPSEMALQVLNAAPIPPPKMKKTLGSPSRKQRGKRRDKILLRGKNKPKEKD